MSVLSIATGTETALYNVTATASTTATDVVSDTATTLVTQTTDVSTTVTAVSANPWLNTPFGIDQVAEI